MPDRFRFDHLPIRGIIYHRCIDCGFPEVEQTLTEKKREKHFNEHRKEEERRRERKQKDNLALARRVKRQKEREDALITERSGRGKSES